MTRNAIFQKLLAIVNDITFTWHLDIIHSDTIISDLVADSLDQCDLWQRIEETFGLVIRPEHWEQFTTIGCIKNYLFNHLNQKSCQ